MKSVYRDFLRNNFNISERVTDMVAEAEESLSDMFAEADSICEVNQVKVLSAFQKSHINDTHFGWTTGYGYDDAGREAVERVYAAVFGTEAALVRPNIVNGTHAIATALLGLLRPGDELVYITGTPYDTLLKVIGKEGDVHTGTIRDLGVTYKELPLKEGDIDFDNIGSVINEKTRIVAMQRSTGYDYRPAIPLAGIKRAAEIVKSIDDRIILFTDNCYGEFVETQEPTDYGVDVMAGSLIKNPGGGLALSGGYIVGEEDLIEKISYRLTCPGIGGECGLTYGMNRQVLQGLFLAPKVVNSAVKAAMLCGVIYSGLGFEVVPPAFSRRSDIIQAIKFESPEKTTAFCRAIQSAAPVDSYVTPVPSDMPGYDDQVIMAAGAFVQGSSIELSADAPMREPYIAYFQGGLTYEHAKFGLIKSLQNMYNKGFIDA